MRTLTAILISLLASYGIAKAQDSTACAIPETQTNLLSGSAFVKAASAYVALPGMVVTEDPSIQTNISVTCTPFDGKYGSITGFRWDNGSKKVREEVDFGLAYEFKPSPNSGKILSKLKASLGWVNWMFTDGINDDVAEGIVTYNGPVNVTVIADKLTGKPDFATTFLVNQNISLTDKLTFTPEVRASVVNNFYGHTGWTQATLAGTLTYAIGTNVSATLEGYIQKDPLNKDDMVKDIASAKIGINATF